MVESLETLGRRLDTVKGWLISLIGFVACLVAGPGWLKLAALVWLIYPAFCVRRWITSRT
jgi:hypothetical protein